jgi:hypothetical protein
VRRPYDSLKKRLEAAATSKRRRIPTVSEAIGRALFHQQDRRIDTGHMDPADWKTEAEWIEYARGCAIERGADPDEPLYDPPSGEPPGAVRQ